MGLQLGYKRGQTYGFVMLITVIIVSITSGEMVTLKLDGREVNNIIPASETVKDSYRNKYPQWTNEGKSNTNLGEKCNISLQCIDDNAACVSDEERGPKVCRCKSNFEEIKLTVISYCALKKGGTIRNLGQNCSTTFQCLVQHAECVFVQDRTQKVCRCKMGYQEIERDKFSYCAVITARPNKNQETYKAAMVALACFILVILGLFLMFILNRSIQGRRLNVLERGGSNSTSREDIFSVCDQLARERLSDKPPTYEDVALTDHQVLGMPPPIYYANEEESLFTNAAIAARQIRSSNAADAIRQSPFSNAAVPSEQSPSLDAAIATRHFTFQNVLEDPRQYPSSNEATASEHSSSLNVASATGHFQSLNAMNAGHYNEAFVSDAGHDPVEN